MTTIASISVTTRRYSAAFGSSRVVKLGAPGRPVVRVIGVQGPPGASQASYTHTQSTALAIWTVAHNLNRRPSVTVVDNLDQRVEPDVAYVDANTVRVTHATPQVGKAYCN